MGTTITTARLKLVLQSPAEVLQAIAQLPPEHAAEVSPGWLDRIRALTEPDPWLCGYTILLRMSDLPIGSCGFKGAPDAAGCVEIAYQIEPPHQGNGYATEAAAALAAFALAQPAVARVCAHTLPEPNASTRVLDKCGFRQVGTVTDPDDGPVWRWEITRPA